MHTFLGLFIREFFRAGQKVSMRLNITFAKNRKILRYVVWKSLELKKHLSGELHTRRGET